MIITKFENYKIKGHSSCAENSVESHPEIQAYKPGNDPDKWSLQKYDGLKLYQWHKLTPVPQPIGPLFLVEETLEMPKILQGWLSETYPLMDFDDLTELDYSDVIKFARWVEGSVGL